MCVGEREDFLLNFLLASTDFLLIFLPFFLSLKQFFASHIDPVIFCCLRTKRGHSAASLPGLTQFSPRASASINEAYLQWPRNFRGLSNFASLCLPTNLEVLHEIFVTTKFIFKSEMFRNDVFRRKFGNVGTCWEPKSMQSSPPGFSKNKHFLLFGAKPTFLKVLIDNANQLRQIF